jgi:glycosyltransferase involved in cell wall biosynthesis
MPHMKLTSWQPLMVGTVHIEDAAAGAASPLAGLRVGYAPLSPSLEQPGDRRRFPYYAEHRGVRFEIADPAQDYDMVVVSQRADVVRWAEHRGRTRLVYDLIDAYLAGPPGIDWKSRGRGLAKYAIGEISRPVLDYRSAIVAMCERADAVVCSTPRQKRDIERYSGNVHIVLDAHFELGDTVKRGYTAGPVLNLVWEGQAENIPALSVVAEALSDSRLAERTAVHLFTDLEYFRYLRRVGRRSSVKLGRQMFPRVYFYEWNPHLFASVVTGSDIALVPVDLSTPLTAGKPENKLLLFWRLGMPVIASASEAYERVAGEAGVAGMTARDAGDWRVALERYGPDDEARREAAERGLRYVTEHHSEEQLLARWDRVFESVLER